ncbi:MAG: 16S rRNA (cytosine(967)-C(5))-methyltransferase RsmB [Nitrospirae bacterium]|nr:16S rRNA (cytosine(967)-C(5))-methyltransferase RsmB [Nitrospirota bacterium]
MQTTRELALKALHEIWQRGRKPKDVLDDLSESLDKRDRAFLMELVYGVVRFRDTLDWALEDFLKKPSGLGHDTLNNLRLAAYQMLFMRVPHWAAVNEAVEMEKKEGRPELVNAVLRNVLRNLDSLLERLRDTKADKTVKYIATLTSHPRWLIKRWVKRFGEDVTMELAEANNRIPPLTLRVNTLKGMKQQVINELSKIGIEGEPTTYSPVGIKLKGFHIYKEIFFLKGLIMVQDEASQLISYLLDPRPGERILDACAAPGGKTTHTAQLMQDSGEVVAVEFDRKRMERLRENIGHLGLSSIKAVQTDILEYSAKEPFDRVLLDAPCSALGVIRRNPDVKYRHKPQDLLRFKANQINILRHVSKFLKPGGIMVYSVCSTEPEEGEEVIKEFLKESGDFYIIDTPLLFLKGFIKDGFLRTYPHMHDMDGFFGVRLCRKA